jgi:hypothetical protein
MFVENYRLDTMIGGQAQSVIPYPKISDEDWRKWKAFLPVKSVPFCKKVLFDTRETFLQAVYGIPPDVSREMVRGANYFEEIEVWGKREISKDPIAVAITENGSRHPEFRRGFGYLRNFWLSFMVAILLAIGYIGAFLKD